ncbi:MAG: phosphoribosylglycinamide formyltransferase [Elusimicrobia bacterium]|nr:phosphoribosylglycinamide formyltransferase [Elusimicrobiota bacterium]
MIRIAVFVSGSGTNLQSLIDSCKTGFIPGNIVLVISSNPGAYALRRAEKNGIETAVVVRKDFGDKENFSAAILEILKGKDINLICLAGFLQQLGGNIIREYERRIINIHPALLPDFGGRGMYGMRVHEAVIKSKAEYSGCTVHYVDEEYDHGPVIMQKRVAVEENDTPETLAEKVLKEEHKLYPEAVRKFALGQIGLSGGAAEKG